MDALVKNADKLLGQATALSGSSFCAALQHLSETHLRPFIKQRGELPELLGHHGAADVISTTARAERLLNRAWSAAADGDAAALGEVFAPDVVWRTHGRNPLTGEFHGRDRVIAQMARITDFTDDLRLELVEVP